MDTPSALVLDSNSLNESTPLLLQSCNERNDTKEKYVLKRSMTFANGFAFVVGMLLGSGVFISPGLVAKRSPNMFIVIVVWVVSGLLSLLGASIYCELASLFPKTGSTYIFIYETFGKIPAFVFVWSYFWIVVPTSLAVVTFTTGSYLVAPFFDDHNCASFIWSAKCVGFVILVTLSIINCLGVEQFSKAQYAFTCSQASVIVLILGMGIYQAASTGDASNFKTSVVFGNTSDVFTLNGIHLLGLSLYDALWAYDGWGCIPYLSEELQNPHRNVPLLTFTSIPVVTTVYVMLNVAFMTTLTKDEMARSETIATSMAQKIFRTRYSFIIPVLVAFTCLGSISASIFSVARFYLSAAREGQLPSCFAWIHRERRTPIPAILVNLLLTLLWLLAGNSAETFIAYFNFTLWIFYGIAFACVLVLRYTRRQEERTYRVYLITPIIMCVVAFVLALASFLTAPLGSGLCLLFILCGIPVYYIFLGRQILSKVQIACCVSLMCRLQKTLNLTPCDFSDDP